MPIDAEKLEPSELGLPATLRSYQWDGVTFLFRSEGAVLADEMGLGKTVQAAVALSLVMRLPDVQRALVVAPSSLTLNWERELARWAPNLAVRRARGPVDERSACYLLPIPVVIVSYDQIRVDALDRIPTESFDVVILDEAQRIKNRNSRTAFACRLLPRRRSWALTATPLENSRSDLESIFAFVKPGMLTPSLPKAELFRRSGPHLLRRRKVDVLPELPPVITQDLVLELGEVQRRAYDGVWNRRFELLDGEKRPILNTALFALLTKLKQICNYDPDSEESSKLEALETVLDSMIAPTDKLIVFSQYVETLNWISERITDLPCEVFHGGLDAEERDAMIRRFEDQAGPRVLLISLRAGGVGLNLGSASTVVLFDRWWNPAVEMQAVFRAHRFERTGPLEVIRMLVQDSVEERIQAILDAKGQLFKEYVEGAPTAAVETLSRAELLRVLEISGQFAGSVPDQKER